MDCSKKIKVLIVDDTVVYRKIVSDILSDIPEVQVVGTANNGKIAISRIQILKPDLLILDVEMPEVDGLGVLEHIKENSLDIKAIMLSSFTQDGSQRTIKALELGAFDFISKPETDSMDQSRQAVRTSLVSVIKSFVRHAALSNILKGKDTGTPEKPATPKRTAPFAGKSGGSSDIIAIGISTGGPNALQMLLPKLPCDLGVPVLIVQHMPPLFTKSLADSLNKKCSLEIAEAHDGQTVEPNVVLIAPGGTQMKIADGPGGKKIIKITDDPPENSCKPSVDYLFRSVSQHYRGKATSVIMTGMGNDGKVGMKLMKRAGAATIAQDQKSCVVYGMPKEVIEAGIVDVVASLESLAYEICKTVKKTEEALV